MVQCLEPKYETMTRGSPYNFSVLNNPVTGRTWENDHKSQLVKPILKAPMGLEQ